MNCKKPRLRKLMLMQLNKEVSELHLTHKDRLLRFGHELVFQLCKWSGANVVVHNESEVVTFEQELCKDVITLMTIFSARLYGKRSHQNRKKDKLIQMAKENNKTLTPSFKEFINKFYSKNNGTQIP